MPSGLGNKLAGQVGEYLVCAELGRRGLIATPFSGNVPTFDVLATDAECRTVPIQVKATRGDNWPSDARNWMNLKLNTATGRQEYNGLTEITNPELIYVCVAIAPVGGKDRFFILTKAQLQQVCDRNYREYMTPRNWKRARKPESYDNRYHISSIAKFEDNWQIIEQRLLDATPEVERRSPLDVEGVDLGLSKEEIVDFVREGRRS